MSDYPRGSEWRKWDLHVHTPASLFHNYPGTDPWDDFLTDLENLPPEFKVIGINDYLFIDGYERVLEEKAKGRLANIDLILPVIELRLDKFGGSSSHLSRVNYHIIFSDEVSPEKIKNHFLNALSSKYDLLPQHTNIKKNARWAATLNRESLEELGQMIIDSVPDSERVNFSTPLNEGFNNLCFSLDSIKAILDSHIFEGKYLTAVGKTEWADIKWNDHSIADKKNIINGANLVFISAENPDAWNQAKESLVNGGVNSCLLDCSDAHTLSTEDIKDKIGKCFTWIKADPTFKGLQQLLNEPDGRIFVGDKPPAISHIEQNSSKYISEMKFQRTDKAKKEEVWFSTDVVLNPGLVAIIGNKGSGKSALADVLALLGNTHANSSFSFLNKSRFLAPKSMLGHMFISSITWLSGNEHSLPLSSRVSETSVELVKYIPQNYLEIICSDLKDTKETQFYSELMEVIYSHVSNEERLGKETLPELIDYLTDEKRDLISQLEDELGAINSSIVSYENQCTEEYKKNLESQLKQRITDLDAHDKAKPLEIKGPEADPQTQEAMRTLTNDLAKLQEQFKLVESQISLKHEVQRKAAMKIAAADKLLSRIENLDRQVKNFCKDSSEDGSVLGLNLKDIIHYKVSSQKVLDVREKSEEEISQVKASLDSNKAGSLEYQLKSIKEDITTKHKQLDEPNRIFQTYLTQLSEWNKNREIMLGSPDIPTSIKGLEAKLSSLSDLPTHIQELKMDRTKLVAEIFTAKNDLLEEYSKLYSPVQDFINQHPISKKHGALQFSASIMVDGFVDKLLSMIHKGKKGSFMGDKEGREILKELVSSNDFTTEEGVQAFLMSIQEHLDYDKRDHKKEPVNLREQLLNISANDFYSYLYGLSYLVPRFELMWHGKPLDQLSPGERGNLLLLFYLLIDKRNIPLIIDQPEENLDNQTIINMLVPAIKEAKERRQIIIVTHNPNLAVVCDADQIIHSQLDKTNGNKIVYTTGSIENPTITKMIVDVLEGTKPAFDLRDAKYDILER
ncbi:hypothetical protein V7O61_03280 [Methanolobus sp. WCC1]|uniref:TrlF family AAA-like ATPase n=1 Tax=unclassified Methanolobus TaxID=2629569 RepID=UPI0032552AC6